MAVPVGDRLVVQSCNIPGPRGRVNFGVSTRWDVLANKDAAPHGSAWHWKQTDCWYYTVPGTKKRMPLFDENGQRVRGRDQQQVAEQALARLKLSGDSNGASPVDDSHWIVARVCSEYLEHCKRSVASAADE